MGFDKALSSIEYRNLIMENHLTGILHKNIHMPNHNQANQKKVRSHASCKKQFLRIDMTPMVDLGFLLITFFIFSAELAKPVASDLYITKDGPSTSLGESDALSVILGENNKIIYYRGNFENAYQNNTIKFSTIESGTGIREVIQQVKFSFRNEKHPVDNLMLLIKPTDLASYGALIGILDEVLINDLKKYAIMDLSPGELKYLENH